MLILCLSFFTGTATAVEFIRICSFNIAEFGEGSHPATRKLDTIADMLVTNDFDLVAIQEVGVGSIGADQVSKLREKMNALVSAGNPQFFYIVTPVCKTPPCSGYRSIASHGITEQRY